MFAYDPALFQTLVKMCVLITGIVIALQIAGGRWGRRMAARIRRYMWVLIEIEPVSEEEIQRELASPDSRILIIDARFR